MKIAIFLRGMVEIFYVKPEDADKALAECKKYDRGAHMEKTWNGPLIDYATFLDHLDSFFDAIDY
jgi:hypothetical protein